ncbi:site-specific integrase [Halobellus sp. GM3]|uniref:site-specific integrase n=1 Tax=Halobellus sp. GM3 TaxID=3458410 RepID=UPI00403E32F2
MSEGLTPTSPAEAVEWYLAEREPELSEKSKSNHRYRLEQFQAFCNEHEIENLNLLSGRDLHRFRVWRSEDVKTVTLAGELQTLRVFLEFCASIEAVEPGMRERVKIPKVDPEEEAKDVHISKDRAEDILGYLDRFAYASRAHVTFSLLWHTGIRLGTLRTFDVGDFDEDEMCLDVRHRPETGTPLKNKQAAERSIAVGSHYCDVINDYLSHNRHQVTDDHGRRPLITSNRGRLSEGSIRETIYRVTQPCEFGSCPHGEDPRTCEARRNGRRARCPSSHSPHAIRRGYITDRLRNGTPQEVVSERSNVSGDIIDQHYDERSEREKMRLRREYLQGE